MKVLLFTHSQDIDGVGCAVLAKVAFVDCEIVPTKTFDINKNVSKYINDKSIYKYDKVFVTDLCIKEPLLNFIDNDNELRNKVTILDHHKTEIEEKNDQYNFVNIIIEENGIKQSGTSLFYKYLLKNNLIEEREVINIFVNWTRQYDVWEWKEAKNNNAKNLHILFENLGFNKYLEIMLHKVNNFNNIEFDNFEKGIIHNYEEKVMEEIKLILENIKVVSLNINKTIYKVGFIKCLYKYRNDINEQIKLNNQFNIDLVGMIITDMDTVSYRQVKDCDVSVIATYFGGKGHREASSNLKNNDFFVKMLKENNIS